MNLITLRNGTQEGEALVRATTLVLKTLANSDNMLNVIAFYELCLLARNSEHCIFSSNVENILIDLAMLQPNKKLNSSIRNIILSAIVGEDENIQIVNPYEKEQGNG